MRGGRDTRDSSRNAVTRISVTQEWSGDGHVETIVPNLRDQPRPDALELAKGRFVDENGVGHLRAFGRGCDQALLMEQLLRQEHLSQRDVVVLPAR